MNILIAIGIVLVGGVVCAGSSYLLANNDTEAAIIGLVGGVLAGIAIRLVL
jgi:hypothetical protein